MTLPSIRTVGADLLAMSAHLPVETLQPGATAVDQDQPVRGLFVLIEGGLTLVRDGQDFADVDHPGALFGDLATVLGRPATVTARASATSRLYVAADPDAFLARPGVALAVLRLTANRLDTMTRYLADVRTQYSHLDNHLGMVGGVLETLLHYQAPPLQAGSARDPLG